MEKSMKLSKLLSSLGNTVTLVWIDFWPDLSSSAKQLKTERKGCGRKKVQASRIHVVTVLTFWQIELIVCNPLTTSRKHSVNDVG